MGRKIGDRSGMTLSLTPEEREEINAEREAAGHDSNRSIIMHAIRQLKIERKSA